MHWSDPVEQWHVTYPRLLTKAGHLQYNTLYMENNETRCHYSLSLVLVSNIDRHEKSLKFASTDGSVKSMHVKSPWSVELSVGLKD